MSKVYIIEFTTYDNLERDSEIVLGVFTEQAAAYKFYVDKKKELFYELGEPTTEKQNLTSWDNWTSGCKCLTITEYEVNKELTNVIDYV